MSALINSDPYSMKPNAFRFPVISQQISAVEQAPDIKTAALDAPLTVRMEILFANRSSG